MDENGKLKNNIAKFLDDVEEKIRKMEGPDGRPIRSERG